MPSLALVKSETFGAVACDFYRNEADEILMTRQQIGEALEYAEPTAAIANIHARNKDRLDPHSGVIKLSTPSGIQETTVYTSKGVMEICRFSRQPKADDFMDWVWDVVESIRKTGAYALPGTKEEAALRRAKAMQVNANTRAFKAIMATAGDKTLSPIAMQLFGLTALEEITGNKIDYRPETGRLWTASDIAAELGISAQALGRIAVKNDLKTAKYGIWALDKSPYGPKQVQTFRYNEAGRAKLIALARPS
jgi:prophage antirepressor-like protein